MLPSNDFTVMTIVGTRPEIIKLSCVMRELDARVRHVLVHTGQNYDYELNEIFFKELELRSPDHVLSVVGETLAETIGSIIVKSDIVMERERPDAVLVYGDTNSCLSVIPAKRRKIPIFHMEAGNRSFDMRVPEEVNRKIVDHTSDVNMTNSEHARRHLLAEGLRPELVMKTGSPMKEVLARYEDNIARSDVHARLKIVPQQYIVVSIHREENVDSDKHFSLLFETLNAMPERYGLSVIMAMHPRTRKRLEAREDRVMDPRIQLLKPLGFFDYVKLQMDAYCVVSDSGTITEESSLLRFPAVTIRNAHERPEGTDEGTLIMSGLRAPDVFRAIDIVVAQHRQNPSAFRIIPDYDVDNVSKKVARIILSYTGYVNRVVWRSEV
ncbi:MAG: UDP-N-acetylglucosamine 2-epimerase (non-hydrolyzing) [bacterium]|nr:UDP-N-acetylglucosamine 2-epimerase (non-hydrolyzing) [bacterium]